MKSNNQQKTLQFYSKTEENALTKEELSRQPILGFIVVAGNGVLYATLQGNDRNIITTFTVELPKRHNEDNKGGSSSVRFARLRLQKRYNYLRKVCEVAAQAFISENKCTVDCIILAGSMDFVKEIANLEKFDPLLQGKITNVVCVSSGFEPGFYQAIEKTLELKLNSKFSRLKCPNQQENIIYEEQKKQIGENSVEQIILPKQQKEKQIQSVNIGCDKTTNPGQIVLE